MFYSQTSQYAIRALIRLYKEMIERGVESVKLQDIAEKEDLPKAYLSRIFHSLTRAKILASQKGLGGGFVFRRPPEKITLWDIISVFDDVEIYDECAIGWERCDDNNSCPLHDTYKPIREKIKEFLQNTTLTQLVEAAERKGLYKKQKERG